MSANLCQLRMSVTKQQISALLTGSAGTFDTIQAKFVAEVLKTSLPIVGDNLADVATAAPLQHFIAYKDAVARALQPFTTAAAPATQSEAAIENAIRGQFDAAGAGLGDVDVTMNGLDVGLRFTSIKSYGQAVGTAADPALGLPGLGLNLPGAQASTTVGYNVTLDVGVAGGKYFVNRGSENLGINFGSSASGAGTANIGDQSFNATLDPMVAPTRLDIGARIDFEGSGNVSQLNASMDPKTTIFGGATVNAQLASSFAALDRPDIQTSLTVNWAFGSPLGKRAEIDGSNTKVATLGNQPVVSFKNIQTDFGSFVTDTLKPVFEKVSTVLGPFDKVIDALNKPIPLLNELGLGDLTLATFIEVYSGVPNFAANVAAVDAVLDFMEAIGSQSGSGFAAIGDLKLAEKGQDIRQAGFDFRKIDLAQAEITRAAVSGQVSALQLAAGNYVSIPVLDGTTNNAFAYLLGQNATLFAVDLPVLAANFNFAQFFPILGPLGVSITGDFGISANLGFGYNRGGFFLDDHIDASGEDAPEVVLTAALKAALELNLPFARAGVGGGLFATVNLDLDDPTLDDPNISLSDLESMVSTGNFFNADGSIDVALGAYLKVGIGPFTKTFSKEFTRSTLVNFTRDPATIAANPPVLAAYEVLGKNGAEVATTVLRLHVGRYETLRDYGKLQDNGSDSWFISSSSPTNGVVRVQRSSSTAGDPGAGPIGYGKATSVHITASNIDMPRIDAPGLFVPLIYEGAADADRVDGGHAGDLLRGGAGDDTLDGGLGNDTVTGGDGNDRITGGPGKDVLRGGEGDDFFEGEFNVMEKDMYLGGGGVDTVDYTGFTQFPLIITLKADANGLVTGYTGLASAKGDTFDSIEHFIGSASGDSLAGSTVGDRLSGGDGDDVIVGGKGDDYLEGGKGADRINGGTASFVGGVFATIPAGIDTASYSTSNAAVRVQLALGQNVGGHATGDLLVNIRNLEGSAHNDTLSGDGQENALFGGDGDDLIYGATIFGGGGRDLLVGGRGRDTIMADGDDVLSWEDMEGRVSIDASAGTAATNVSGTTEIDTFSGAKRFRLTQYSDVFVGDSDDEHITPGLSRESPLGNRFDAVDGNEGTDTVVVDYSLGDNAPATTPAIRSGLSGVVMVPNGGSSVNFVLERSLDGVVLDSVLLFDIEMLDFTGGREADFIPGLSGADTLRGGAGDDTLGGFGGGAFDPTGDTPNGNSGSDFIEGGDGDDLLIAYYSAPFSEAVSVFMDGGKGYDEARIDVSRFAGGITVANGTVQANGTAGAGNYVVVTTGVEEYSIAGGGGNDVFLGRDGRETFFGGSGDDSLSGLGGDDQLGGGFGQDTLLGGNGNDTLSGENGEDAIDGGSGDDLLSGDAGDDRFTISSGQDRIFGGPGQDRIFLDGSISKAPVVLKSTTITFSLTPIKTTGFNPGLSFNGSLLGLQTTTFKEIELFNVVGSKFNDTLYGGPGDDTFRGFAGDDLLAGGGGNDKLSGGEGEDTLAGGPGDDSMAGGPGDDTYLVSSPGDTVNEGPGEGGADDVRTAVDGYTLPANVENLTLLFGAQTAYGNAGANVIRGTRFENFLYSNGGGDALYGDYGNDTYYVSDIRDEAIEMPRQGYDTVEALVDYVLGPNVEALKLINEARNGEGNNLPNFIMGNFQSNELHGGRTNAKGNPAREDDTIVGGNVREGWTGQGEVDLMTGGPGRDHFVIDDNVVPVFYNDGNDRDPGLADFVLLTDFDPSEDKLQVDDDASSFHLAPLRLNVKSRTVELDSAKPNNAQGIFFDTDRSGSFSEFDELVAVVRTTQEFDLDTVLFDVGNLA